MISVFYKLDFLECFFLGIICWLFFWFGFDWGMNEVMFKGKVVVGFLVIDDLYGLGYNWVIGGWLYVLLLLYWMLCFKICCLCWGSGMLCESGECSYEFYVGYCDKVLKYYCCFGYLNWCCRWCGNIYWFYFLWIVVCFILIVWLVKWLI